MKSANSARFDARLTKDQKDFFENAAHLGGFRNLTEFFLYAVQNQANQIMENQNILLKTKRDQELFFKTLTDDSPPNQNLKNALDLYLSNDDQK